MKRMVCILQLLILLSTAALGEGVPGSFQEGQVHYQLSEGVPAVESVTPFIAQPYRFSDFAYFLTVITLRSMAMVFWPLCAMAVSAYVPNRFVVLGTPWLVDYFIGASESRIFRSSYGNYGRRFAQFTVGSANYMEPGVALIQLLVRYLPCIALCAVLFYLGAKRRLKND